MRQSPVDRHRHEPAPDAVDRAGGTVTPLRPRRGAPVEVPAPFGAERRDNLPAQLTSFVGREREVVELTRLLEDRRLVTLVGAPGVGKTRLALRVAEEVRARFPDGAWLVELAPLADPGLVSQAIAAALGVRESGGRPIVDVLQGALGPRRLLLVVDNCEHLVEACAELAADLLRAGPRVRILATSRELLAVAGEAAWRVPSLSLPDPDRPPPPERLVDCEAVRLFVERVQLVTSSFAVTEANAAAVAEVCRRLDGIPLALEMAAARLRMLSAEQLARRLDDRFRLLGGGSRVTLPRQQTLRSTVDWSHDLLTEEERMLFRRLSVFAGGWTLEAAEAVCGDGDVLDLLAALVDKSLVVVEEQDGQARYRMLETLRAYGLEKLGQAGEGAMIRSRHQRWLLALAEEGALLLTGEFRPDWYRRMGAEIDNVRAALAWGRAAAADAPAGRGGLETADPSPLEAALRLAAAAYMLWLWRGHLGEGRAWLEELLALDRATPAPPTPEGRRARIHASVILGSLLAFGGHGAAAVAPLTEGAELALAAGDQLARIQALGVLGNVALMAGQLERASALENEALSLARAGRFPHLVAGGLFNLGAAALAGGDPRRAEGLYEEVLAIFREQDLAWGVADALGGLARAVSALGDHARAAALHREGLPARLAMDDRAGLLYTLESLAREAAALGQAEHAAMLLGAAASLEDHLGLTRVSLPAAQEERDAAVAAARSALGVAAFDTAFARGRQLSRAEAIELALREEEPSAPDRAPGALELLTERERQIAGLVAAGRTNRQIAEALVISERTAEWHVAKLRARLELETRGQLGVWAARHGLAPDPEA